MTVRPCHINAEPGDDRALCGVRHAMPVVWADAAQRHVDGYGLELCPECEQAWRDRDL